MPTKYLSQTALAFLLTALTAVCLAQETVPLMGREVDGESIMGQVATTIVIGTNGIAKKEFENDIGRLVMMVGDGKVWPDRTGDGAIEEDDWEPVTPGQGFTVKANLGDGKADYSFMVENIRKQTISLYSITCREGKFLGQRIRLFDSGGNGRYDDLRSDEVVYGDPGIRSFLMENISLGGSFYTAEVVSNGIALKLTPFKGKMDTLQLKYSSPTVGSRIDMTTIDRAHNVSVRNKQKVQVTPGKYKITSCTTSVEKHGTVCEFVGTKGIQQALLTITNGLNMLKVGTPLELKFAAGSVKRANDEIMLADIWLEGAGGEHYELVHRHGGRERRYDVKLRANIREGSRLSRLSMTHDHDSLEQARVSLAGYSLTEDSEFVLNYSSSVLGSLEATIPFSSITNPALRSLEYKLAAYRHHWILTDPEKLEVLEHNLNTYLVSALQINELSWFLLTADDASLHDYPRALELAKRAVKFSNETNHHILDTLAVAYYKSQNLEKAVHYSRMAAAIDPEDTEIVDRAKAYELELRTGKVPDPDDEGEDW